MVTKGRWVAVYDRDEDTYHIYARREKESNIWLAEIESKADADMIVDAVNACKSINESNPQAAAEAITDMCEALKGFTIAENVLKRIGYADELNEANKALLKAEGGE